MGDCGERGADAAGWGELRGTFWISKYLYTDGAFQCRVSTIFQRKASRYRTLVPLNINPNPSPILLV